MSSNLAISVSGLGKCYSTYERPQYRLKQSLYGLAAQLVPNANLRHTLLARAQACARNFWALDNINLEVKKGETVGIIGRNGSGKSTLLQIICGTLTPTHGEISVKGRVAALLELGSGFNPEYSGRDNVYLNGQLLGLTRDQISQRFDDISAFADIGDFIDQPVKSYSSGMYVRLAFAVIAHVDADILVIDEALAVGDAFFTQKCMRFLRKFMRTGTVLFVSHDTEAVKSLCSKAIWIDKGVVLQSGSAKAVCDKYLQAFYESQTAPVNTTKRSLKQILNKPQFKHTEIRPPAESGRTVRNDIRLFSFEPEVDGFGSGAAKISGVEFFNSEDQPVTWLVGGELVRLSISAQIHAQRYAPIIGFYVKDRLGQILFGDNTYLTYLASPLVLTSDQEVQANFSFVMPVLPKGDYSICVAIAEGDIESHVPAHWLNDALVFRSEASPVAAGLVGIPMLGIEMGKIDN